MGAVADRAVAECSGAGIAAQPSSGAGSRAMRIAVHTFITRIAPHTMLPRIADFVSTSTAVTTALLSSLPAGDQFHAQIPRSTWWK